MAGKIFISYRRADSTPYAGRVYDRLGSEFGRERLFMDVDTIRLGVDFIKALREEVAKCDVLLVVIGDGWLNAQEICAATRKSQNFRAAGACAAAQRCTLPGRSAGAYPYPPWQPGAGKPSCRAYL